MNEWFIVSGAMILLITIVGFIFGWGWKVIQDVKKSAHARIERLEDDFKDMEHDCTTRLTTYVNKEDMNRLDTDMKDGFATLGGRIDNLILAYTKNNGISKNA